MTDEIRHHCDSITRRVQFDNQSTRMNTTNQQTEDHSTIAGLRSRLQTIIESAEKAQAYLDNQKKWRHVASFIADIQQESETAEQQINQLL